jgi:hypothetical protein
MSPDVMKDASSTTICICKRCDTYGKMMIDEQHMSTPRVEFVLRMPTNDHVVGRCTR